MIFFLLVGAMATVAGLAWIRHLSHLKQHAGVSRDEFIQYFEPALITPEVSGAVYDHFQKLGVRKGFMPAITDSLEGVYKTSGEDVEDNLSDILQRLGYEMPHSGILAEWAGPIETVEDVVRFVGWVRTRQSPSGSIAGIPRQQ